VLGRWQRRELKLQATAHGVYIKVAIYHHGEILRLIPTRVEPGEPLGGRRLEY
jgi:hypothetical protein